MHQVGHKYSDYNIHFVRHLINVMEPYHANVQYRSSYIKTNKFVHGYLTPPLTNFITLAMLVSVRVHSKSKIMPRDKSSSMSFSNARFRSTETLTTIYTIYLEGP